MIELQDAILKEEEFPWAIWREMIFDTIHAKTSVEYTGEIIVGKAKTARLKLTQRRSRF